MRTLAKAVVVALTLFGGNAFAQVVSAQVTVAAPTVHFEVAPPLVYVSPGVMVVQDYDEEVFFVGGWYWCTRGGVWFRTHDYRGGWVAAPARYVPARLVHVPPGHYRNFHGGPGHPVRYQGGGPYRGGPGVHVARPYGGGPARGPMMARGGRGGGPVHVAGPARGGGGGGGPVHVAGPARGGGGGGGVHVAGPPHGGGGGHDRRR